MRAARPGLSLPARLAERASEDTEILLRGMQGAAVAVLAAAVLATSMTTPPALADLPTSAPEVGVFDDANVMGKSSEGLFAKAVTSIEKRAGVHVRFVMLLSLPFGETPDEYAKQLAQEWSLGGSDVLFVASTKLARAGVYVGGDVTTLSAETAHSIAEETFAAAAAEERYGAALLDVSNRLIPVLNGDADPGPPKTAAAESQANYKTKSETKSDRSKYIKVVGGVLVISIVAPLVQTYWYVRDD